MEFYYIYTAEVRDEGLSEDLTGKKESIKEILDDPTNKGIKIDFIKKFEDEDREAKTVNAETNEYINKIIIVIGYYEEWFLDDDIRQYLNSTDNLDLEKFRNLNKNKRV